MTDEIKVIRQVQKGDTQAFETLVTAHEKQVYNLCLRMVGNPEDAADLAQEAFLKAWRSLPGYKFESAFSTWLYRLTGNLCIDFLRRQKRRPTAAQLPEQNEEDPVMELPDTAPSVEQQLTHKEDRRAVADAMMDLEEEFRLVLTLRVVEELSYEQIGQVLDLPVGTVKSRLARARIKLRKILLEHGNFFLGESSKGVERGKRHDL